MRKRLPLIALVVCLVMVLCTAFSACDIGKRQIIINPDDSINIGGDDGGGENESGGGNGGGNETSITSKEALNKMIGSLSGNENEVASIKANFDVKVEETPYRLNFGANVKDEITLSATLADNSGKTVFGFYIHNNHFYLDFGETLLGQNPKVYLEDFDVDYILNLAGKIPSLDDILESVGGSLPIDLSSIIYSSLFKIDSYNVNGSTETIKMNVAVYDVVMLVLMLVSGLNIPSLLQSAGIRLPAGFDLAKIIQKLEVPYFAIGVTSVIDAGKMDSFDVSIVDANNENIFNIDSSFELSENRLEDIGLPSDISNFVPISLTNFSLTAVLDLQGNDLDVGSIVNMIAGSTVLPANTLMLNAEMFITAKVQIDLDLDDNAKNMVLLEFYNGVEKTENRLIGVYYYKGELMVNVSELLSFLNIPNIKITDIDITEQLQKLVNIIQSAIDPQASAVQPSVLSMSQTRNNDYVISPDISSFINGLFGMLEFQDNIIIGDNQISLVVDKAFIEKILDMVMSFDPIPDPENPGEFLPNPARPVIPDFGRAELDVNLSQYGIDNVNLNYRAPEGIDATLNLNLNNFLVGYAPVGIEENILAAIESKEYVTNVKDLIYGLTDGIAAAVNFDVTIKAGTYNVMELVNNFLDQPLPALNWTFSEDFVLNLKLDFRFTLDRKDPSKTKAFLEIHVLNDNFPLAAKGLLAGIYYENNTAYIDLSHITVANMSFPKLFIDVKLADKLIETIETLQINFLLEDILKLIQPSSVSVLGQNASNVQTLEEMNVAEFLGIAIQINPEALKLRASLNAVMALLQSFGVDLGIELPDFDISMEVNKDMPLQISLSSVDKAFTAYLGVSKLSIGDPVEIGFPPFDKTEYATKVLSAFIDKLMHIDIEGSIAVNTQSTVFSIQNLINNIMLADGQKFNIPVDLNLYDYSNVINVKLKWNLDKANPKNSEALLEIRTDRGNFFVGIYISKGNLYIDLKELGFFKFGIENSVIVDKLIEMIYGAVEKIDIDLTETVNNLFAKLETQSIAPMLENTAIFPDYDVDPEMETMDLIALILSCVDLTDLDVGVDLTSEVMYQLMLALGVDLGMDITASIKIDIMQGNISGNIDLDIAQVDFDFSIKNIGVNNPINFASGFFTGYAGIDTTTAELFADGLLNALDLELWIDINTKHVDTAGSDFPTRLRIYKTPIAKTIFKGGTISAVGIPAAEYGPLTASAGSIIIELYYEHKNSTPQIVIVLDVNEKQLKIGAADSFLTVNIVVQKIKAGGAIRINVAVDIKEALMGLYDTIFGKGGILEPTQKTQTVSLLADTASGGGIGDLIGDVNIEQLISKIDLSILPTDNLKVQIKLNGRKVNELLTNLLTGLFPMLADMGIDMSSMGIDASVFKNVKYDNVNANVFANSLYNNVVAPLVTNMVGKTLYDIAKGDIEWTVKNLIKHFLPLPAFTDLDAEMNIINGRLCNIKIDGEDTDRNNYMKIHIYNQKIFTQEIQQVVDWGDQDTHITYDPYNDETNDITQYFVNSVKASSQTDMVGGATNHTVNIGWDFSALQKDENGLYIPGTYIVRGVGTNDSKVSLDVTVEVLDMPQIESIEEVRANPYDKLPNKIVAVFASGAKREISNVVINAMPETYKEHTVTGKVTLRGVDYDVPVHYTDNTIALVYNAPVGIDPYTYKEALTQFPSQLFVAFENGRRYVMDTEWDLSNLSSLTPEQWAKGGEYVVYATIKDQGITQTIEHTVMVLCKELSHVQINSVNNVFELNPYLYNLEGESVYPQTVRAFYTDDTSELVEITWSGDIQYSFNGNDKKRIVSFTAGDILWDQEITVRLVEKKIFNIVFEDGDTMFNINPYELLEKGVDLFPTLASIHFTDGTYMDMPIRWNAADIAMLIENFSFEERFYLLHVEFGFEVEGLLQSKLIRVANKRVVLNGLKNDSLSIDPLTYLYEGENPYPTVMEFVTDRGETVELPVVWDASDVDITLGGGKYQANVTVGSGEYKTTFSITVNVEARKITGTPKDTFVLDIADYIENGFETYPSQWQFYFGETILTLDIEWTDIENILMRPGTYDAEVVIGKGTPAAQRYTLQVQVVDSRQEQAA